MWKVSEKTKRAEGFNLRDENGTARSTNSITSLRIPVIKPMELMVEATPKRVFSNAHTYHINSISLNSDQETFLSADDLRINLWHTEVTNQSFSKYYYFLDSPQINKFNKNLNKIIKEKKNYIFPPANHTCVNNTTQY